MAEDGEFLASLGRVYDEFKAYMERPNLEGEPQIAYFSMEFGIHPSLKIYSGGLGILAGDYLKESSDSNVDIIGIGLLYRYGYFTQKLGSKGEQIAVYEAEDFSRLPIHPVKGSDDNQLTISYLGREESSKSVSGWLWWER